MRRVVLLVAMAGCGATPASTSSSPAPARRAAADTSTGALIPFGYGTLTQEQVAIELTVDNVVVRLIPLDEWVIRTLSPDVYRTLHAQAEGRRDAIAAAASMRGLRARRLWRATYFGLTPDARFTAGDVTVTSGGRDFRPLETFPLTSRFGEGRVQPRDQQIAIYLFDDAVDVSQPVAVTIGGSRNTSWGEGTDPILQKVERETALIRSRAAAAAPSKP